MAEITHPKNYVGKKVIANTQGNVLTHPGGSVQSIFAAGKSIGTIKSWLMFKDDLFWVIDDNGKYGVIKYEKGKFRTDDGTVFDDSLGDYRHKDIDELITDKLPSLSGFSFNKIILFLILIIVAIILLKYGYVIKTVHSKVA